MTTLLTEKKTAALRETIASWRAAGEKIALVPTMGALHEGHLSLVKLAQKLADRVVVSIFVNPMQFGPKEDLSRYPRPLEDDLAKLAGAKADLAFLPEPEEMYGKGFSTVISVKGLSERLCGPVRPGHFDGVATVVAKLFLLTSPHLAVFGEKDYQQLQIIKRMVRDLHLPLDIIPAPVIREEDGLAMSSRNRYLSGEERHIASEIHRVMRRMAEMIKAEEGVTAKAISWGREALQKAGFSRIDYVEVCDAETLEPLAAVASPARILVAAWIGKTRLIDNIAL